MSKIVSPAHQEELFYAALLQTVSERGMGRRSIQEVTTGDVRAMAKACMAKLPKPRPADLAPPGPKPSKPRVRPSQARDKSVAVPAPEEPAAGRDCGAADDCGDASIGWRHYVGQGWLPVCTRHMTGAGASVRSLDAGQRMRFRAAKDAVAAGRPPEASNAPDGSPAAPVVCEAVSGPPGADGA